MNDDEIKTLAKDIRAGKVFGSWSIDDADTRTMTLVFMPLSLMSRPQIADLQATEPAAFYEYLDKAGPRSVNGLPVFFSFKTLNAVEHQSLVRVMKALEDAEAAVLLTV